MKKMIIVRHGAYAFLSETPGGLTEKGVEQITDAAQAISRRVSANTPEDIRVFSTQLTRAIQSGEIIGKTLGANPHPVKLALDEESCLRREGDFISLMDHFIMCQKDYVIFSCHLPNISGILRNLMEKDFRMPPRFVEVASEHQSFSNGEFCVIDVEEKTVRP